MSQIGAFLGGAFGDPGQNFVNEQGGADKVFGTKPQVAAPSYVDLNAELGKTTSFNLANFEAISGLLDKYIPGFSDILAQESKNTQAELRGELPPDVLNQIYQSDAFKGLQFSGAPIGKALTAADIGNTSLGLTQIGENSFQTWSKLAEEAFSPFTLSVGQTAGTTAANNALKQAYQQNKFNVEAAPDPGALGVFNIDAALGSKFLDFGLASLGGIGGGKSSTIQAPVFNSQGINTGNSLGGNYAYDWRTGSTWGGVG